MTIQQYIDKINGRYKNGNTTEHSFRGDLQTLIESICPNIIVTNEPTRISCGAPDYILTRKDIPVGYIEAKDIGDSDLLGEKKTGNKEQFDRYRTSLNNLITTDYLNFNLFIDGELKISIKIGEVSNGRLIGVPENYSNFENLIKNFCEYVGQTIKSSKRLAEMMAGKARMLADVLERSLNSDEDLQEDSTIKDQMNAFKTILIHDIKPKEFADIYAQTIAYGMFAARLHDPTLPTFSRQEAAELIPKTNPFLRKLFGYIAGPDIDERIKWIVDALAEIFRSTDVAELLKNFGKATQTNDPIIHFYETFLAEYDPALRKARGVWYTPEPIVNFIVRSVDEILKKEFSLKEGLADITKTKISFKIPTHDKRYKAGLRELEQEVHKLQILDPATGTGTFLSEVIKHIYSGFADQKGIWNSYVESHLIPRLNGFELLMASYAMAHLKLDLLLSETGFKQVKEQRFKIYLTNSLEEFHPETGTIWANWLSSEANEANKIKRDTPIMVVVGNPPYSGESSNKGSWIMSLMEDYKKEPGGKQRLQEQNPKWINDDYVKFLRYGQFFIEKNGEGILAFINPHGFIDNPTFRGMRWNLLKTYDKIITIDLHGNANKKEKSPDGSVDENVFDIMQGVSINFFIKTGKKKSNELGKVLQYDLFGKREYKYDFLWNNSISSIKFNEIKYSAPNYFFVQKDVKLQKIYDKGFKLNELFIQNVLGYQTHRDNFAVDFKKENLERRIQDFVDPNISESELKQKYDINESEAWKLSKQREKLRRIVEYKKFITKTSYRPFDTRYVILHPTICDRPRTEILQNVLNKDNYCLLVSRQQAKEGFRHVFITKLPANDCVMSTTSREANQVFPLFIYPTEGQISIKENISPNFNSQIIEKLEEILEIPFTVESKKSKSFTPINILDYIYAVLHSKSYREIYKEFLKVDFPRIPFPNDKNVFFELTKLGEELRIIHLMEFEMKDSGISYPIEGSNIIGNNISYTNHKVFINDSQYFEGISEEVWNFYIGGYQPAQKWLKDRKNMPLDFEDIKHYRKIIAAIKLTLKIMAQIDKINFLK